MVERIDRDSQQLAEALSGDFYKVVMMICALAFPVIAKTANDLTGTRFAVIGQHPADRLEPDLR